MFNGFNRTIPNGPIVVEMKIPLLPSFSDCSSEEQKPLFL